MNLNVVDSDPQHDYYTLRSNITCHYHITFPCEFSLLQFIKNGNHGNVYKWSLYGNNMFILCSSPVFKPEVDNS